MNIDYKKLESLDYPYISQIMDDNFKEIIAQSFNGYFNYAIFFDRAIRIGHSYIVYYDEQRCGFFWYTIRGQILHVNTIVIDKNYQGKGIGSRIFFELEKIAKEKGFLSIQLGVQGVNKSAREFYEKRGFKEIGYMKEFDTFYMEKKL